MAHEMSVTLTDEEYAELSAEAAKSGEPVEALVHTILAQRLRPTSPPAYSMTSHEFTEQQYRVGKVLSVPTREPITVEEAAELEHLAQLLEEASPLLRWLSRIVGHADSDLCLCR